MSYGRYFEDLEVWRHFQHPLGRTITEFDDTLFSLMAMISIPFTSMNITRVEPSTAGVWWSVLW